MSFREAFTTSDDHCRMQKLANACAVNNDWCVFENTEKEKWSRAYISVIGKRTYTINVKKEVQDWIPLFKKGSHVPLLLFLETVFSLITWSNFYICRYSINIYNHHTYSYISFHEVLEIQKETATLYTRILNVFSVI